MGYSTTCVLPNPTAFSPCPWSLKSRGSFIRGSNGEKEVLKRTIIIKQELCISGPQICVDNNWNLFDIQ